MARRPPMTMDMMLYEDPRAMQSVMVSPAEEALLRARDVELRDRPVEGNVASPVDLAQMMAGPAGHAIMRSLAARRAAQVADLGPVPMTMGEPGGMGPPVGKPMGVRQPLTPSEAGLLPGNAPGMRRPELTADDFPMLGMPPPEPLPNLSMAPAGPANPAGVGPSGPPPMSERIMDLLSRTMNMRAGQAAPGSTVPARFPVGRR